MLAGAADAGNRLLDDRHHVRVVLPADEAEAGGEIAGVEGVDGVFIGPGDLSTSLGYLGQQNHPDVVAIIAETIARITKAGKHAGILTANEDLAHRYIAAGTRFTAVGSDMGLLARQSEALASRFRA